MADEEELPDLTPETFPLHLILAEEQRAAAATHETFEQTHVLDLEDVTFDGTQMFSPPGLGSEIEGPGHLEDFLVIAQSDPFGVGVLSDNAKVVRATFTELESISTELADIAAFESNGQFVISVADVSFIGWLTLVIFTRDEVTFDRIRADLTLSRQLAPPT